MVQNKSIGEEKRGQLEPIKFVSGYTVESVREGGRHRQKKAIMIYPEDQHRTFLLEKKRGDNTYRSRINDLYLKKGKVLCMIAMLSMIAILNISLVQNGRQVCKQL